MELVDTRVPGEHHTLVGDTDCLHHIFVSFSRDSRFVYAHLGSDHVKGFETGTWKPYASYATHSERTIASMSDDLGRVVTAKEGRDPAVVTVSTRDEKRLDQPLESTNEVLYAIDDAGSFVVAYDEKHRARVWSAKTARVVLDVAPD
jgi:hypothetical protein